MFENSKYPLDLARIVQKGATKEFGADSRIDPPSYSLEILEELLDVAYHATFFREEGRQVKFRLIYEFSLPNSPVEGQHAGRRFALENSLPFDAHSLKKLALAAPMDTSAILIALENGSLKIRGLYSEGRGVEHGRKPYLAFHTYIFSATELALHIAARKPGCLEIYGRYGLNTRLSGGRLEEFSRQEIHENAWILADRTANFKDQVDKAGKMAADLAFPRGVPEWAIANGFDLIFSFVEAVLAGMRDQGHGGTLAFVADRPGGIESGYCLFHPEKNRMLRLVANRHRLRAEERNEKESEPPSDSWPTYDSTKLLMAKDDWFDLIDSVVGMTAVDGFVILDSRFDIVGFNAFVTEKTPEADEFVERKSGARTRSAYTFCQQNEFSTVFVCSQDGDITAFFNRGKNTEPEKLGIELDVVY